MLRAEQGARYEEWTRVLSDLVARTDLAVPVDGLIGLIDGIGLRAALEPDTLPPSRQLELVDAYLQVAVSPTGTSGR